jgi:hypothetical protein
MYARTDAFRFFLLTHNLELESLLGLCLEKLTPQRDTGKPGVLTLKDILSR